MEKCGGLQLTLKMAGKAMSNKKKSPRLGIILNSLENSVTSKVQGVEESFHLILKFNYDNLPQNIHECFLWASSLWGSSKDDLWECWMGLGLNNDFVNLQQDYHEARYIF